MLISKRNHLQSACDVDRTDRGIKSSEAAPFWGRAGRASDQGGGGGGGPIGRRSLAAVFAFFRFGLLGFVAPSDRITRMREEITITNPAGLHARPAAEFVKRA